VRSLQSTCQVVIRHGVDIVERLMVGRCGEEEIEGGEESCEQAGRVPTVTSPNARHCWLDTVTKGLYLRFAENANIM